MDEISVAFREVPSKEASSHSALPNALAVTDAGSNTRLSAHLEPEGLSGEEQSREAKSAFMGGGFMAGAAAGAGVGIAVGGPVGAIVGTAVGAIAGVAGGAAVGAVVQPNAVNTPGGDAKSAISGPWAGSSSSTK